MPDQQPLLTTELPGAEPRPDQLPTPAIGDDESVDVGSDQVTNEPELPETDRQIGSVERGGDPRGQSPPDFADAPDHKVTNDQRPANSSHVADGSAASHQTQEDGEFGRPPANRAERLGAALASRGIRLPEPFQPDATADRVLDTLLAALSHPASGSAVDSHEETTQAALSIEPASTATPHAVTDDSQHISKDGGSKSIGHVQENRNQLVERIQRSRKLPKGLRDRLEAVVHSVQLSRDGDEEPSIRVSDAVAMLEESMPAHLQLEPDELDRATHPGGEGFFTGDARDLSDEEAERIAAEQLVSAGFAPRPGKSGKDTSVQEEGT